jgi:predicted nucleic acid-binding Zn ribbon protein
MSRNEYFFVVVVLAAGLALTGCEDSERHGATRLDVSKKKPVAAKPAADKVAGDKPAYTKKPPAAAASKPAADDGKAAVYFAYPLAGGKVQENFEVAFGVKNVDVVPAGESPDDATKGHHHLIVDAGPIPKGQVVPKDETHMHFGKGQTTTKVKLAPGKHKLTMQFADGAHRSYGPDMASSIEIEVVAGGPAKVSFVQPADGAKVKSPVKLVFALEGMTVRPAGEDPLDGTSGHHHIVVDGAAVPLGEVVGKDATHIHFGKGQTETELKLAPGKHTLTMQLADGGHRSYGPSASSTITVEVTE